MTLDSTTRETIMKVNDTDVLKATVLAGHATEEVVIKVAGKQISEEEMRRY